MSYGWWNDKHNRHHANPNHDDLDPDVGPGVLVWSSRPGERRRGADTVHHPSPGGLFFPLLTCSRHQPASWSSIKALPRRTAEAPRPGERPAGRCTSSPTSTALLIVLSPLQALAFFVVHQALFGVYLGIDFAPNHKGMPHPDGETEDYLRKQVLTSRNVRGGWLTDVALGGLNYQIEHHLFPGMPTPEPAQGAADRGAVLQGEGHPLPRDGADPLLARSPHRTPRPRRTTPQQARERRIEQARRARIAWRSGPVCSPP